MILGISDYLNLSGWIHVLMLMLWMYMWFEWLIVVNKEFICQKSYMWVCCVFVKNEWMMKLWFDEFGMNSWLIVVVDVWNMLLMNWCNDYAYCWIDDQSCCCCWIFMKVWWNIEFWQNGVWILNFEHHWVCVHVFDL